MFLELGICAVQFFLDKQENSCCRSSLHNFTQLSIFYSNAAAILFLFYSFMIVYKTWFSNYLLFLQRRSWKELVVDIWERNKELIRKRTDIGEHFTREVIQSIVFIFLALGERVHLTNRSITTNPLGNKECLSMWVINREDCNRSLLLTLVRMIYCSIGEANGI